MEIDLPRTPAITRPETLSFRLQRAAMNVDADSRTVGNVVMAQVQEARGHGYEIEQSFLTDMNQYVADQMDGRVQCNLGHRYNALGFQFGAFSNLRIEGKKFVGDLKVYEAADKSPAMQGAAAWFFSLVKEDAKAVMCSITFVPLHYYQYDDKKNKVIITYHWYYGVEKAFEDRPAYVAFKELISCDIVDEGALTASLFSTNGTAGTQLLQLTETPGFIEWFKDNHQHFAKLSEFYAEQHRFSMKKFFGNIFSSSASQSNPTMEPNNTAAPTATTTTSAPAATTTAAAADTVTDPVAQQLASMQDQLTQLTSQNTQLREELNALKEAPAAPPTTVKDTNPPRVNAGADKRPWESSDINQRAKRMSDAVKRTEVKE